MPFKLDIGDPKSKQTFHVETASEDFIGKKIGDTIKGSIIKEFSLADYEFIITGASDKAGLPALPFVEGSGRKKVLLTRGKGLKKVRKKKKLKKPVKGLRLRKAVHGNIIDEDISQINLKVTKQGAKPLEQILIKKEEAKEETKEEVKEAKPEIKEEKKPEEKPAEKPKETKAEKPKAEEKPKEKKEEIKEEVKEEKRVEEKKKEEAKPEVK